MSPKDQSILFTALAFLAVALKGDKIDQTAAPEQISKLARLIDSYCNENTARIFPISTVILTDEIGCKDIDRALEHHLNELMEAGHTELPENRETLLNYYDRLNHRATRQMYRDMMAAAKPEQLSKQIVNHLSSMIERGEGLLL